jgi:hypothetical protein
VVRRALCRAILQLDSTRACCLGDDSGNYQFIISHVLSGDQSYMCLVPILVICLKEVTIDRQTATNDSFGSGHTTCLIGRTKY